MVQGERGGGMMEKAFFYFKKSSHIYIFNFLDCAACGILVSQPGVEPAPLVLKVGVLSIGQPGKPLENFYFYQIHFFFFMIRWAISPPCKRYSVLESHEYNSHANIATKKKKT